MHRALVIGKRPVENAVLGACTSVVRCGKVGSLLESGMKVFVSHKYNADLFLNGSNPAMGKKVGGLWCSGQRVLQVKVEK